MPDHSCNNYSDQMIKNAKSHLPAKPFTVPSHEGIERKLFCLIKLFILQSINNIKATYPK